MKLKYLIFLPVLLVFALKAQSSEDYYRAVKYYQDGRYFEAYSLFETFLKVKIPEDELYASAKFYASEALFNIGQYGGAMAGYEYIVNKFQYSSFQAVALYKLALIYMYHNDWEKARVHLMTFARIYNGQSNYGSVLFYIGETYRKTNDYTNALYYYKLAAENRKTNKFKVETLFYIGECHEYFGDYADAADTYETIINDYPDNPYTKGARIKLGVSYFKAGEYERAIIEFLGPDFQNMSPEEKKEASLVLASSLFHTQDYTRAEEEYLKIFRNEKDKKSRTSREALYGIAWCKFQTAKYDSAAVIFTELSAAKDSIAEGATFWSAESKRYLGNNTEAVKEYETFIAKFPQSTYYEVANIGLGLALLAEKDYGRAYGIFNRFQNSSDNGIKAKANVLLGELNSNNKKYVEAIKNFEIAAEVAPQKSDLQSRALLGQGVCYFLMESLDKAYDILRDIQGKRTNFEPDIYNFYLGEIFFERKDFKTALDYYSRVEPNHGEFGKLALYGRAYSYFNIKDYQNAKYSFLDFIQRFPSETRIVDAKVRLAESYFATRDFESSAKVYDGLLKGTGGVDKNLLRYNYALTLYNMGKKDDAIKELRTVIKDTKGTQLEENSRFMIGWIYFKSQDYEKAITTYNDFLKSSDDTTIIPIVYYNLGDCYYNLENYEKAGVYYAKVLDEYPNSPQVYDAFNGLFFSYFSQGQTEEVFVLFDRFLENNPRLKDSDRLFLKRAELYFNSGDFEKSKMQYQSFIEVFAASPFLSEAYYGLGVTYQATGENSQAINSFRWVVEKYDTSSFAPLAAIKLVNIYIDEKMFSEADEMITQSLQKYPKDQSVPEMKYLKGVILLDQGDTLSAYDQFDKVINEHVGNQFADRAYIQKGLIELNSARYDNAIKAFQYVGLRRDDNIGAEAQYLLGVAYFTKGDYKDAITALVRVENVFSEFGEWLAKSYLKLADIYVKQKENKKAVSILEKLVENHPDDEYGTEAKKRLKDLRKKK
ncbi:MAG: tetratricopeptide repeat protein [Ignavibacteriales bacterium]|nr:MAG: tetratricopeptide repeat protein [Ignavibacteriaceae bacterium]MBV6446060.1 Outer membrane protein assembly factor BamD [Ignavibacteriaceae bacterium]MBW7872043.1 tetratricopeptide repeat protein [Ignavibacteria bacterium]MBZ0195713.1 tetratricopeptide repeat protein [Ignavibacteriaceae bacterium]MCZ2143678.1 tetratricopeptide repeat protein [Ignavibacteriales bacterium]